MCGVIVMKVLVQRVNSASVTVDEKRISEIGLGLLVLLGIKDSDTQKEIDYIIRKIINLRIFSDDNSFMSKSVLDVGGEILLVSQFTLYGDCCKGNRPSFTRAMSPGLAKNFYDNFADCLKKQYPKVKEGVFGAYMQVSLVNDGPVTILIDSEK